MAVGSIPNKGIRDKPHSSLSCFAIRLKPGQEIRKCLLSYVKENNLKAPFVLSCVGSVTSATLRLANVSKDTPNEIIEVEGIHEIVSLAGTLADEGHLNAALSDKDGHVVGGHVMGNMKVFTTAEVVIGNCDMLSFTREIDEETGFDELVVKEKASQRPFFTPQMQQIRPRWQPMQQQQQMRPSGMQMPGGGQVPRARGIRQVPPRGQPVRGLGAMQGQPPRPAYKFQQNVRNQPQTHPGAVPMQNQERVQQPITIPGQEPLDPSALAAATHPEQKQMLGERLFPLIQAIHPHRAGKITGMLLENDNAELLHMLESREALQAKTEEALSVLKAHNAKEKADSMKN